MDDPEAKARLLTWYTDHGIPLFPIYPIRADGSCACGNARCTNPGKHPATPNGFKDATTEGGRILAYHTRVPLANWALRTGVVADVLDIDVHHGGLDSLDVIEAGLGVCLAACTWIGLTGSGGYHLYFRHYAGLGCSIGRLGPGLDVRAEGGYALLPPSNHKSHPAPWAYSWDSAPWAQDLAPWPQALAEKAMGPKPVAVPPPLPPRLLAEMGKQVPAWLHDLARSGASQGQRHDKGLWVACRARQFVRDAGMAYAVLQTFAHCCTPPMDEREMERIWSESAKLQGFDPRYHPRAQRYSIEVASNG